MVDELKEQVVVAQTEVNTEVNTEVKQPEAPKVESNKEYNLRILRERAEKAEMRAAELERLASQTQYQPRMEQKVESVDEDFDIDDESYVDGKVLKKQLKALKAQQNKIERISQEQAAAMESYQAEIELNQRYPDAKEILTEENLKNLASIYPQDYKDIMATPSLKTRAKLAYLAIKNQEIASNFTVEDKKLAENKLKPRSAASVPSQGGETPLSKFQDYGRRVLSDSQKDEIMRRVQLAKSLR